jgi:hypothetical protein
MFRIDVLAVDFFYSKLTAGMRRLLGGCQEYLPVLSLPDLLNYAILCVHNIFINVKLDKARFESNTRMLMIDKFISCKLDQYDSLKYKK